MISERTIRIIRRLYYLVILVIFFKFCNLVLTDKPSSRDDREVNIPPTVEKTSKALESNNNDSYNFKTESTSNYNNSSTYNYESAKAKSEKFSSDNYSTNDEPINEYPDDYERVQDYKDPIKTEKVYYSTDVRVGAWCNDGTYSNATGSGACSHHGGVAEWVYE